MRVAFPLDAGGQSGPTWPGPTAAVQGRASSVMYLGNPPVLDNRLVLDNPPVLGTALFGYIRGLLSMHQRACSPARHAGCSTGSS